MGSDTNSRSCGSGNQSTSRHCDARAATIRWHRSCAIYYCGKLRLCKHSLPSLFANVYRRKRTFQWNGCKNGRFGRRQKKYLGMAVSIKHYQTSTGCHTRIVCKIQVLFLVLSQALVLFEAIIILERHTVAVKENGTCMHGGRSRCCDVSLDI
jgi:hypothetical protein